MRSQFVVSFGPNQSYYFNNGRKSIWNNVPGDLAKLLNDDARFSTEKVTYVSLGRDAAYFIKSSAGWACGNVPPLAQNMANELGGWKSIQWIMFTPDPNTFLILDENGQVFGNNFSQDFHNAVLRYAFYGFQDISLGVDGGYALSTKNKLIYYKNMPEGFVQAWKSGDVAQVTTSTFDQFYFIEFQNCASAYRCPDSWHSAIDELRNAVPRVSSGSSTANAPASIETNAALESARHNMTMAAIGSMATGVDRHGRPVYGV